MTRAKPATPRAHYEGHRERLRERFRNSGADALADYELLELILNSALPRRDTKPLAKALIDEFGSFAEAIAAERTRILAVKGAGERVADELQLAHAAALRVAKARAVERTAIGSWSELIAYCRAAMAHESKEQFRILFLDRKNRVIADEVQQRGTVDHTPVYPREVIKRALELSSTAIILVHNHPSGDPTPSRADIDMTKKIIDASGNLGITVHDHVIIGRDGHASFRALKLI